MEPSSAADRQRSWPGSDLGLPESGPGSLASIGERAGAAMLDLIGLFAVTLPLVALEALVRAITGIEAGEDSDAISSVFALSLLFVWAAYWPVSSRLIGTTPGKRIVGLQVLRATGERAGALLQMVRGFVMLVLWGACVVPGALDVHAATRSPLRQSWHDQLFGTVVVRRGRSGTRPVPRVGREPWVGLVSEALNARARFAQAAGGQGKGPLRDRLDRIETEVDACHVECQRIAARGEQLSELASAIDLAALSGRVEDARSRAAARPADADAAALVSATESQLQSAQAMHDLVASTEARLRRLVAQLGDAVNRALVIVFDEPDARRVDAVLDELRGLRAGLVEIEGDLPEPG